MVYMLNKDVLAFPNPHYGEPDGLFAVGADLSLDRMILAYSNGIFPWYSFQRGDEIMWYCPMERFVIDPKKIHISHSMRTLLNKNRYTFTVNADFSRVLDECSTVNGRYEEEGAWLGPDIKNAFKAMHQAGYAHSIEVWDGEELVGGLYGVLVNRCFVGDSMFSLKPNGSKIALVALSRIAVQNDVVMIDCQLETPHLKSMGGQTISYDRYMQIIRGEVDSIE